MDTNQHQTYWIRPEGHTAVTAPVAEAHVAQPDDYALLDQLCELTRQGNTSAQQFLQLDDAIYRRLLQTYPASEAA